MRDAQVLWLIPDENWPLCNLLLCAALWSVAAHRCFALTHHLRSQAEQAPLPTLALLAATAAAHAAARHWPCDAIAETAVAGACAAVRSFTYGVSFPGLVSFFFS